MVKQFSSIILMSAMTISLAITSASADPIKERQDKMKIVGKNMGIVGKMAKGQAEFDAQAALAAFVAMKEAADGYETLFPEGTETGGETEAAPAIFSDRTGFEKKVADFEASLVKVTASAPANIAELGASVGAVGQNCGVCHKAYRVKKN
jgi:cytochrome c556